MTNGQWAKTILEQLSRAGIDEFILCPGARNAPFVKLLSKCRDVRLHSFFEERSAGFFALGRAVQSRRPKAILTTSGTAVANLLPAIIEAHYAGVPIVIVSADRPKSYRGTGSPQTIVQPGIFTGYARSLGDIEKDDMVPLKLDPLGPSHLNVCFDEPLIDAVIEPWTLPASDWQPLRETGGSSQALRDFQANRHRPLILVGGLSLQKREMVRDWLAKQSCPVYLEACSGLRGEPSLSSVAVQTAELGDHDGVVRLGHIPTARIWRDLEKSAVPVLSIVELPFSGLARASTVLPLEMNTLGDVRFTHANWKSIVDVNVRKAIAFDALLEKFPRSEPALFRRLSQQINATDHVYLGNSLPIREWDLAARRDVCFSNCYANRGANGIDGQISTFFGWASGDKNWAVIGDLTAMYDLSAPWCLRTRELKPFHLVIVNNGGGRIFKPMFGEPLFENEHRISFENWAKMWNLSYSVWNGDGPITAQVIEIKPDMDQSDALRRSL